MTLSTPATPPARPVSSTTAAVPRLRAGGLVVLLVVEVVAVSLPNWWLTVTGEGRYALQVVLTFAVTSVVFGDARLGRTVAALGRLLARRPLPAGLLAAQIVAFLAFLTLTWWLAKRVQADEPWPPAEVAAWAAAGVAALALWGLAVAPPRVWALVARRGAGVFGVATVSGSLAWVAARYAEHLWLPLADRTVAAVAALLSLAFDGVVVDPARRVVGAGSFVVEVGPTCSGFEGFGLVAAVVGSYLWFSRTSLRFPNALLLLPLALAASWVMNVVRIVALLAIGALGWPRVAGGGFHTHAGWIAFCAVALGVVVLGRSSAWFRRPVAGRAGPAARSGPTLAPYLLPLMALAATAMVTGAMSGDETFDRYYPLRVVVVGLVLCGYRPVYAGLAWGWSPAALGMGAGVFAGWVALEALLPPGAEHEGTDAFTRLPTLERNVWLFARVVGAAVVVPLAEELVFRGYLYRRLQWLDPRDGRPVRWSWWAAAGSSLVFGLLHPGRWVAGTLAGVAYAWVFTRRGRLADAVVAHGVTNALLAAYVLATGRWGLW